MTTDQVGAKSEDELLTVEEKEPAYFFSPEVIETLGRSVQLVVGERLCDGALLKQKEPDAWKTMTFKELRKLFKDCGDQDGYLSPQAPLLETVVRMLLASKRDSLSLSEIHADVSALWISSPWPRHISIESLQRVLDHGATYAVLRSE
ncbi:MAG: hypothetical protein O3B65_00580 [Chloroflexi bacterium]|nr:hypothetical protein [Chloroflexota bacterium]